MTASAGVALARDGQATRRRAPAATPTRALSAAKSGGRDRSAMFDTSLHERAMQRLETERALVRALAGKAIEARFQPIVSSTNGSIVGVEALARLRDPELGLIPPEAFIGVAEDRGLAAEIDCAMLAAACELAARLSDAPGSPWVAFNASSQLVEDPDLVDEVLAACARSSIEPGRLCLEVTERALMHATGGTREALAAAARRRGGDRDRRLRHGLRLADLPARVSRDEPQDRPRLRGRREHRSQRRGDRPGRREPRSRTRDERSPPKESSTSLRSSCCARCTAITCRDSSSARP